MEVYARSCSDEHNAAIEGFMKRELLTVLRGEYPGVQEKKFNVTVEPDGKKYCIDGPLYTYTMYGEIA